jgi:GNAT superfamily N-acetyltransferase
MTTTPTLIIRRARQDDVATIVQLLADDDLGRTRECMELPLPPSYLAAFAAIDTDPRQELIVVERADIVIGTLQLTFLTGLSYQGGTRAQVEGVRVDTRYRGQGIGQQMMAWATDRARQQGCYAIQLTSHKERVGAHRFYMRLGFVASHVGLKLMLG